jgi:ligand-binding sensor domain-containing protein
MTTGWFASSLAAIALSVQAAVAAAGDFPENPVFNLVKPSTTGIPGEEVRVMTVDPEGNLWIAARWPFWSECAIAMLPPEEQILPSHPNGFDTGKWTVWSNVHHPIPSPYIHDVEFAPDGIMWIASDGGLTRFDRHAATPEAMWQTWDGPNSPLGVSGVASIDSDSEGHIWLVNAVVSGPSGQLFEFDPATETWTHHAYASAANAVTVGLDGNVYVTRDFISGFSTYDGFTWTHQPGGTGFAGIMQDLEGNLWFGGAIGSLGGVWKWNGSTFQQWGLDVTGISRGLDGTVYVATWYGPIYKMINGTTPEYWLDAQGVPRSVIERPNGDFFINNYGSTLALGRVRHYGPDGSLLRRMNTYNCGLPDYWISTIMEDSDGNTWFGSSEAGISRMEGSDGANPTRWRNFGDHNDLAEEYPFAGSEPMYAMYEDDQGFFWLGGNGVGKWDPKTASFVGFWNYSNSNLKGSNITKFVQDKDGSIWAASQSSGIYRYNPDLNDWEQQLFGVGFATNSIAGLAVDNDGILWVATPTGLHFNAGSGWLGIGPFHGLQAESPTCLSADPDGGMWVGADNGLFRYINGEWTHYHTGNSPLPINHVVHIDIRPDGVLGINVTDGLVNPPETAVVLFDGESEWQVYPTDAHPFSHWQIEHVGFDSDGDLWVSCLSEGVVEIVLHDTIAPGPAGDINGDGLIDGADLGALLSAWGGCDSTCSADLNGDNTVDGTDLGLLLANWS